MDKDENKSGSYVNIIEGDFSTPFSIPASITGNGTFEVQKTNWQIFPGKTTKVFSYQSNSILGPIIVMNSGEQLSLTVQNSLDESTNIHWHGLSIPADMDGHPMDVITSGSTFTYVYQVNQRASFYWYHPHPDGATASQVFKGLAGGFIVRDAEENLLNLPDGVREVPLILQDKRIFPDYSIDYSLQMGEIMTGYLGEYPLVNGKYSPNLIVETTIYRFRVLNGSNARIYNLALSTNDNFTIIGSDGGLLASPETTNSILLGPGERLDLLIDFSIYALGTELFLSSSPFSNAGVQGLQEFRIMKFIIGQQNPMVYSIPINLSVVPPIPESSALKTRLFEIGNMSMGMGSGNMGGHTINGLTFDSSAINETVQSGTTEIWEFDNSMGKEAHPMHIHGVQFQILDRIGGRNNLIASETGWKDTVLVLPGEKVRTIMTFGGNLGVFILHCHNLEHEDDGMMLQFEIV
ncbi:MAG: multicopper oxidase domain-containing protein [Crocinitomicaceae bacterium]